MARPTSPSGAEDAPSPEGLVLDLVRLLDVEQIDTDLFRAMPQPGKQGRVFGGQVIAQGLVAATRSLDGQAHSDKIAHSLHAYFLRPGDESHPILYRVTRDFDGSTFSNRRVIASQRDRVILNMAVSFQQPEDGFAHQVAMPIVPSPEDVASELDSLRQEYGEIPKSLPWLSRAMPFEFHPVQPRAVGDGRRRPAHNEIWFRTVAPLGDERNIHRAVLAYASDKALLTTSLFPHGIGWETPGFQSASLDHAVWIHEPFRADEWLLYATESPWTGHGRGFNLGRIFTQDGRCIASVAQEALIRVRGENANISRRG